MLELFRARANVINLKKILTKKAIKGKTEIQRHFFTTEATEFTESDKTQKTG